MGGTWAAALFSPIPCFLFLRCFFLLTGVLMVSHAGRDTKGPIELVIPASDLQDGGNLEDVAMDTGKMDDNGRTIKISEENLYKLLDERLLSFSHHHLQPIINKIIQELERISESMVKLDGQMYSIQEDVQEIRKNQQSVPNQSVHGQMDSSISSSLDDLDRKLTHIERQVKLSATSTLLSTVEDVKERTRDIQYRMDNVERIGRDVLARVESMDGRLESSLENSKVDQKVTNVQQTTKLDDHQLARLENLIKNQSNYQLLDISKEIDYQTSSISRIEVLLVDQQQSNGRQHQHQKWPDFATEIVDAVDRLESVCGSIQKKDSEVDNNDGLKVVQSRLEDIGHQLNSIQWTSAHSQGLLISNVSRLSTQMEKLQEYAVSNKHDCGLIQPLLNQVSEMFNFKYEKLLDVCMSRSNGDHHDSTAVLGEPVLQHIKQKVDLMSDPALTKNLHLKVNITQEKVDYLSTLMTILQMDMSSVSLNLEALTRKGQNSDHVLHEFQKEMRDFKDKFIRTGGSTNCSNPTTKPKHDDWMRNHVKELNSKVDRLLSSRSDGNHSAVHLRHHQIHKENIADSIDALTLEVTRIGQAVDKLSRETVTNEELNWLSSASDHTKKACEEAERLVRQSAIDLREMKGSLVVYGKENANPPALSSVLQKLDNIHSKVNSMTPESLDQFAMFLESSKAEGRNDLTYHSAIAMIPAIYQQLSAINDSTFASLKSLQQDLKMLLVQLHPLLELPSQLYNITHSSSSSSAQSEMDTFVWSRTSHLLESMSDLHDRIEEKFSRLKTSLQTAVDDGMVEIVDILGQNKAWLQQTSTAFVNQHADDLVKMKETVSTLVAKGFENLHFMYQYLNGKLDKIHHIASHNLEDCADIQNSGHSTSGIYTIYPRNSKEMRVYCDMDTEGGGWTVIQRRKDFDSRISFNRTWLDYKYGFGNLEREFWLGNEHIHILTRQNNYLLRIDMIYAEPDARLQRHKRKFWHNLKNDSKPLHAQYLHFVVLAEHSNYSLTYGKYVGIHPYDGLEGRQGSAFTTWDHSKDINLQHCATIQGGGWWYGPECFRYALNSKPKRHYWEDGSLFTGITWGGTADFALLKTVEMKILPQSVYQRNLGQSEYKGL